VDCLVRLGQATPEPFLSRLRSEKSQMVRDMLRIIDRCNFPQKAIAFGQALAHRNPAVRREVFALLGKMPSELSRKVLQEQLSDSSSPARPQIARAFAEVWPDRAVIELSRIIRGPEFDKASLEDRKTYFEALGVTGDPGAFALCMEWLKRHSVLARRKVTDGKLCAIAGLTHLGGVTAYRALQDEHEDASNPDEVKEAALKGMLALRRQILGDGAGGA
jgi:HEAT repeat protein